VTTQRQKPSSAGNPRPHSKALIELMVDADLSLIRNQMAGKIRGAQ
jgi:hypothetical protein